MSLFILTAGLLILGVLGAFVVVASRRRVWPPRVESVELEAIPEDHFERMRPVAEELTRLGLRFEGFQCETCGPDEQVWQAVFGSRDGSVWAVSESGRRGGAGLVLHSFISNGRTVTTSDGEFSSLRATDDWRLSEFSWNDILAQVDFHRQACLGAGGHVVGLPQADEFKDLFAAAMEKQLDHLLSTRALREDAGEPGAMRLSPCRAPRVSLRLILHQRLVQWREKNRGRQRKEAAEVDAAAGERERYEQVKGFKYLDYYRRDRQSGGLLTRLGWSGKGVVLFASLVVLAVVLYLRGTLDAGSLGIIAGVLLVHEAGHLGMMKLFGYRDLSVFLLPGAGVAAGGGKVRPPAWQEFWVLMSGPLPGLLAGGAVMVHAYLHGGVSEFWQQWAWFSVVVNGFSLLPVVPFDGGRVVELLLLERMPLLRVIYQVLGAVFLVLLGALDWVLLLLAVPAIAAIPDAWRIFRMGSWIRKNLSPEHDDREALLRTFQIIDQTHSAGALGKPGWTLFVDKLLRMGCSRKLGIAAALVAMIAYLAILLSPVMLVGGAALRERHCYLAERDFVKQRALALAHKVETRGSAVMPVTRAAMEQLEARQAVARRSGVEAAAGSGMGDRAVIRGLAWEQVAAWVEEEGGGERREVVRDAIEALVGHAGRAVRDGDVGEGMEDLTLAYEAVLACEPRAALHEWIDWLSLEYRVLRQLEKAGSENVVPDEYNRWFVEALTRAPHPGGLKMASLALGDLHAGRHNLPGGAATTLQPPVVTAVGQPVRPGGDQEAGAKSLRKDWLSLTDVFDLFRAMRGVPGKLATTSTLEAASHFETQDEVMEFPPDVVSSKRQAALWEARISAIRGLVEYRRLASAALRIELAEGERREGGLTQIGGAPLPVSVQLRKREDGYEVQSTTAEGGAMSWRIQPGGWRGR